MAGKERSFTHLDTTTMFEQVLPLSRHANVLRRFIELNDGNRHNDHDTTPSSAGLFSISRGLFVSSEFSADRAAAYLTVLNEALVDKTLSKEERDRLQATITPVIKAVQASAYVRDPRALEARRAELVEEEQRLAAMQEAGTTSGRAWDLQTKRIAEIRADIDNATNPDARHIRGIRETDIPRAGGEAARRTLTTQLTTALTLIEARLDELARPLPTGTAGGERERQ